MFCCCFRWLGGLYGPRLLHSQHLSGSDVLPWGSRSQYNSTPQLTYSRSSGLLSARQLSGSSGGHTYPTRGKHVQQQVRRFWTAEEQSTRFGIRDLSYSVLKKNVAGRDTSPENRYYHKRRFHCLPKQWKSLDTNVALDPIDFYYTL